VPTQSNLVGDHLRGADPPQRADAYRIGRIDMPGAQMSRWAAGQTDRRWPG
jgi:hypothetical protein